MSDSMNNSILDTVKETCEVFSKYELTKGELAKIGRASCRERV